MGAFCMVLPSNLAMWRVRGVASVGAGWWRGMCGEAEVRVFWDLNRCGCGGAEAEEVRIAPNIVCALRSSGLSGPVSIQAYGNTRALSNQRFLHSLLATGVDLHHVPGAMKDLSNHLLLDLLFWVKENPPPAHMLLISDDKEYSSIMHKLHMRGYNVLLAHPEGDISPDLLSAASKVWVWDSMMKGTKLVARTCESGALPKIVNPLYSKHVLTRSVNHNESQFSYNQDVQAELDTRSDNFSHDSKTKSKNISKEVVKQVVDVIRLRPSGFTLGAFRRQLGRSNVVLDKDFYGHKDLLSFLLSVPQLKASLVWTSEKTRTYIFTENFSTDVRNDNEGRVCARCDYTKDFLSPKYEMLQVEEEESSHLGTRIENVSAFQQLNCRSAKKEHSKGIITEKVTGKTAKSPGIVADGKNAFSIAWRKVLSKFSFMTKSFQFVGIKVARTEMASSETLLACKSIESKLKNQHLDIAAFKGIANSKASKEEGKQNTAAQMVSSKENPKEVGFKMPERAMHDCIDCPTSDSVQENREKQSEVPEILEENGRERHFAKRESKPTLQGQEHELENDTVSSFLQVGEHTILKEALKDTGLENQLSEDILSYLLNEGRRSLFTRATTMDDVLKFLMESNLRGVAQLKHEELVQVAEIFHARTVKQIKNHIDCNTQSLLSDTVVVPKEQALHKNNGNMSKAKEDGSMLMNTIDLYTADIILTDLKKLLVDCKCGVRLASLKPLFKQTFGYELNHKALGHRHLASLISSLGDFMLRRTSSGDHFILSSSSHEHQTNGRTVDTI